MRCHQVEVDVEDHFSLDEQVEVEDQRVERGIDRALDGVLDRDEADVHLPVLDRFEHSAIRVFGTNTAAA